LDVAGERPVLDQFEVEVGSVVAVAVARRLWQAG